MIIRQLIDEQRREWWVNKFELFDELCCDCWTSKLELINELRYE